MKTNTKSKSGWIWLAVLWGALLTLGLLSTSCTRTEYVEVPKVHTEYVHTTDSILMVDTVIDHQQTIIRELDSVAMAQFGITLENAQRAWLVEKSQLQREISKQKEVKSDTLVVTDTVGVPVPVTKIQRVEKPLTWWQQFRLMLGNIMLVVIGIALAYATLSLYKKYKP